MGSVIKKNSTNKEERQEAFLKVYPTAGTIAAAAKAIGIRSPTVQEWIKKDPMFAAKFEEARQGFVEELENIAFDLVKEMAQKRDYKANPTLLIFMLNGNAPHKYRGLVENSSEARDLLSEFRKMASKVEKTPPKEVKNTAAQKAVLKYEEEKKPLNERLGSLKNGNTDSE